LSEYLHLGFQRCVLPTLLSTISRDFLSFAETAVRQTITASIKFHGILYASVMPHHEHALDLLRPVEIRNAIERRLEVIFYCDDKWLLRNATLFSGVIERRQINVNNGCSQRRSEGVRAAPGGTC